MYKFATSGLATQVTARCTASVYAVDFQLFANL